MSTARIELTLEKIQVGDNYLMHAYVGQSVSTPEALRKCLKVRKGSPTQDEKLWSIADYSDLYPTQVPDDLPTTVDLFTSASIPDATVNIGDKITLSTYPDIWSQFYAGFVSTYTITGVSGSAPNIELTVGSPFPTFGRNMTFRIYASDGVTPVYPAAGVLPLTDGVANRDYTGLSGTYYLATMSDADLGTDLQVALDKQPALESQAQALVDAVNLNDDFLGTDTEVFE